MGRFYDKDGKEVDLFAWASLWEDDEYRTVGRHKVDSYFVSTVWLGIGPLMREGMESVFETLVTNEGDESYTRIFRYPNIQAAKDGHEDIVKRLEKKTFRFRQEVPVDKPEETTTSIPKRRKARKDERCDSIILKVEERCVYPTSHPTVPNCGVRRLNHVGISHAFVSAKEATK